MTVYRVWDAINGGHEYAENIEADTPEAAAVAYGESDRDGWTDGLYHGCAQPIAVEAPDGTRQVFDVEAELTPVFRAVPCREADR